MLIKENFICKIYQKNNCIFTIEWIDGKIEDYRLCDLQRNCNCARCVDELSGRRIVDASSISDDLTAKRVYSVGRYALKVDFTTGCSRGIYPYSMLRKLAAP